MKKQFLIGEKLQTKAFKVLSIVIAVIVPLLVVLYINYSSQASSQEGRIDPGFRAFISAYTAGVVSSESAIRVRLNQDVADSTMIGKAAEGKLFRFEPALEGRAIWTDSRTVEFRPKNRMPYGQKFTARFKLSNLMEVPAAFDVFEFNFQTMIQNFEINTEGLRTYDKKDLKRQKLHGTLITADVADNNDIENILSGFQHNHKLNISWDHDSDRKTHRFVVENIQRQDAAGEVDLKWDGAALKISNSGSRKIIIPALGDFKLMEARVVQSPEQYVSLQFSDPLLETQSLEGLIDIEKNYNLNFIINENEIKVYPHFRQTGTKKISISSGIRNISGYKMKNTFSQDLIFEQIKPAVRLVGKGVILPSSEGLIFPFEAVSLKAVEVKIIKIYESNIGQFLQVNRLDGDYELRRVGKPVAKVTVPLNASGVTDFGKWSRYTLDLAEHINAEPGAIYQVNIGFNKKHSVFYCGEESVSSNEMEELDDDNWDDADQNEYSYWDYYDSYYYDSDYDWNQRENPCHSSYYGSRRSVKRNILASDLGIIAKGGNKNNLLFAITDLRTTEPQSGVAVEIYDYQNKLITSGITDSDGILTVSPTSKPFLLIAKKDRQRGYLKLDDGSSLNMSNFEVHGERIEKGLKGFLYGERDVWRPGDSLYFTFIIEDKEQTLPKKHPVILELYNPQGQLDKKIVKTNSVAGFYNFGTVTSPDAPTGNWMAKVKVGGAIFSKRVKIETVKPNRLKINLDFGTDKLTAAKHQLYGHLSVKWLHGVVAKGLKADFEVVLSQAKTIFPKFKDYVFDDPSREFHSESRNIFEGRLDDSGKATIVSSLFVDDAAPGMLMAHFNGKVFEEGGDFSVDRFSIPYYPYKSFVGIMTPEGDKARGMLLTDTAHTVSIVTVDTDGKQVSKRGIELELYKLNWRWWWDQSEDHISNYIGRSHNSPIAKGKINTNSNGMGEWNFRVNYPEWGRFFVRACDPESGHCTGKVVYLDWPGWAGRSTRKNALGATMLSFSADKESYNVGEKATLNIPGSGQGRALVSIENGSKVIRTYWVNTQQGETNFTFPVTEEMAPNVYVHISLLQPHSQTVNDLPIRLYGVIPVKVEDPATHLKPVLSMPDVLRPEEKVTVKVSEQNGKPMAYTIAVVDEGLLDLTRFKTPDPWKHFYAREALGVKTWDMYEYVIGATGAKIESLLALGGDEEGLRQENLKTNRFKPVVKYLGPFYLDKGKSATHTFKMPSYVGSVRTMVIAGANGAYGNTEKTVPVKQELMVLATLPRVLGPGESVKLPVSVFAMDDGIKNVTVQVKSNDLVSVEGEEQKQIHFNKAGDQIVDFHLKIKQGIGIAKVTVTATSGDKSAHYTIELNVRNPNPMVTDVYEAIIEPGKSWTGNFTPVGMPGTNKAILELSSLPPINLSQRMKYLLAYPHGCVEQTISTVFPQLFVSNITDMSSKEKEQTEANIKAGIEKLKGFQNPDGGFAYWPGQSDYNDWGSSYAGHFLIEAANKGYYVPEEMMKNWKKFQKARALSWQKNKQYQNDDLIQAYRLYTLALAKSPETGAMNRLREQTNLSIQAKWRLAAAYVLAGQNEAAQQLVENLGHNIPEYKELSFTYGSSVRDHAMILETLVLMNNRTRGMDLLKNISASLSNKNNWYSTQTTAFSIIAVAKFAGLESRNSEMKVSYKLSNESAVKASTELPFIQKDLGIKGAKQESFSITNDGKGVIFARLLIEGKPAAGDQTSVENDLKLDVIYKAMDGTIISPEELEQAKDFYAEVTVYNPGLRGDYKEMALSQIFPSGWEIHNSRMQITEGIRTKDEPSYQDVRDDRVYTYFDLKANQRKTFRVHLNASYSGRFYLPTIYCEAMYDASISARKPGMWVEVKKFEKVM